MKSLKNSPILIAALILLFSSNSFGQKEKWVSLFDGKTLKGWTIHSGFAKYKVENGELIGTSVANSPNSFLCTDREYADFILEFEVFLLSNELNSGVQFRSKIAKDETMFWFRNNKGELKSHTIPKDRVYGYQVEIASAEVGAAGGVYDEARRAMMDNWWPKKGSPESKAFKDGEWNKFRVECKGDAIKTVVNGIVVSEFRDGLSSKGIIGLQVHDVGPNTTPFQVKWRNIRIMELE
jgi:hypothetical protein